MWIREHFIWLIISTSVLILICLLVQYQLKKLRRKRWKSRNSHIPFQGMIQLSHQKLKEYDGIVRSRRWLSIKNMVFDVTISPFYQDKGEYQMLLGKDVSVNLAKMSLNPKWFNQYQITRLNDSEKQILDDWYDRFNKKYCLVGILTVNYQQKLD